MSYPSYSYYTNKSLEQGGGKYIYKSSFESCQGSTLKPAQVHICIVHVVFVSRFSEVAWTFTVIRSMWMPWSCQWIKVQFLANVRPWRLIASHAEQKDSREGPQIQHVMVPSRSLPRAHQSGWWRTLKFLSKLSRFCWFCFFALLSLVSIYYIACTYLK